MTSSRLDYRKSLRAGSRLFAAEWRVSPVEDIRLPELVIVLGKSKIDANQLVLEGAVRSEAENDDCI